MSIKGNNIFSKEEEQIALFLKERNLQNVNLYSRAVMPRRTIYSQYVKRLIDITVSGSVLVFFFPIFAAVSIGNLIDMGTPILYKQTRTGYRGKNFNILKFRSMKNAQDKNGRQLPGDKRLTNYGRFIRKVSLDELPNFINIFKGDMSVIGPRPLPAFYHDRMSERHKMREEVRPGLECPRLIDLDEEKLGYYQVQYENDIWYVENISFVTDIRMLFSLVKMVFASKERGKHADVGTFFVGYNDKGIAISLRMAKKEYAEQFISTCDEY